MQPESTVQSAMDPVAGGAEHEGRASTTATCEEAEPASVRECASCGQEVAASLMFCPKCGRDVGAGKAAETSAPRETERKEAPALARPEFGEKPSAGKKDAASKSKGRGIAPKALAVALGLALVAAAGAVFSHQDKAETYEAAVQMYGSWQIEEAKALFSDLGDFKDSQAMVAECDEILRHLDEIEGRLNSSDPAEVASAWEELARHKGDAPYEAIAAEHGGYPTYYELARIWDLGGAHSSYLQAYYGAKPSEFGAHVYTYHEANYEHENFKHDSIGLSIERSSEAAAPIDELIELAGFGNQLGEGTAHMQYAMKYNRDLHYSYTYKYGATVLGGEDAAWFAFEEVASEQGEELSPSYFIGCAQLDGRSIDDIADLLQVSLEYRSVLSTPSAVFENVLQVYDYKTEAELSSRELYEFEERPAASTSSKTPQSSSQSSDNGRKDELVTDVDGKQVWKVWATSPTMRFTGSYQGQGNFIVKVLDGNQNLDALVCNEIGDWTVDKTVAVTPGKMYYIQVECSRGTWNMQWTGTGGA